MKKILICLYTLLGCAMMMWGQRADYAKMSSMVRQLAMEQQLNGAGSMSHLPTRVQSRKEPSLCAFVRVQGDADRVFDAHGCRVLARFGDVYIAGIPLRSLARLSLEKQVSRIEARQGNALHLDSLGLQINALPAYQGAAPLPQAFTGKGVVVGVQDVGFDLTHPNFYDATATEYRIQAFWDQLSTDTIGSGMYVGASYRGRDALLAYAHSRDGLKQTHGTHTLGIAAGSGYGTPYRGIAYESDICIVSNAVYDDAEFIDSTDYYKYTYATDALGFKYIMDYARQQGRPCVVSFSEGSHQDFHGDDQLYYEILDSLSGPGRIIVASAGNEGGLKTYFRKPSGTGSAGTFVHGKDKAAYFTLTSAHAFDIRFTGYGNSTDTLIVHTADIVAKTDSLYTDTVTLGGRQYVVNIMAYASCYDAAQVAFDVMVRSDDDVGITRPFSFEVMGQGADVEAYRVRGFWVDSSRHPQLNAGEYTHSVYSPGSAPAVVCVGATSYRTHITNYLGQKRVYNQGTLGMRGLYSSVGPTYDKRIKPDVMAPGTNVVSSHSSYYMEQHPDDLLSDVELFSFKGRQYGWNANSGTSMSTPAVAGAIALWLQAKPTLTREEVMEVLRHTCTRYDASLPYPNNWYGHGQIDVYKGLLYILGVSGIQGLSHHQPTGIQFRVEAEGTVQMQFDTRPPHHFSVSVYATSGSLLMQRQYAPGQETYAISLASLPRGVYVVQVNGGHPSVTGSTLVRR